MSAPVDQSGPLQTTVEINEKLNNFFPPKRAVDAEYSNFEIQEISGLLQGLEQTSWSRNPRLYIVLRHIGKMDCMDAFLGAGQTDIWFPYPARDIPEKLHPSTYARFLKYQWIITTKDADLEKGEHCHLTRGALFQNHFKSKRILGSGGFGQVEEIESKDRKETYALKRISRHRVAQAGMTYFTREVDCLKRAEHPHIVKLVGSFTDPDHVGFIMSPVAECDFSTFLKEAHESPQKKSWLWSYFGCLTNALVYLHNTLYIRHKDLKPSNILVKDNIIMLADFGLAHDWSKSLQSTTKEERYRTGKYSAPEVEKDIPRNSASDIWSLGCIFLEMMTILRGESIDTMVRFFKENFTQYSDFKDNLDAVSAWIKTLELNKRSELENMPLDWIRRMLYLNPSDRPTGRELMRCIWDSKSQTDSPTDSSITLFGICCERPHTRANLATRSLYYAIGLQDEGEVLRLLKTGVDPNEGDNEGRTALHLTAEEGQTSIVRLLLDHGLNINIDETDSKGRTPLHVAAETGNQDAAELLINKGANVNAKESFWGYTPLHSAAWFGNEGTVRLLLRMGKPDLEAKSKAGFTPLSLAALWSRNEIVRLLKEAAGTEGVKSEAAVHPEIGDSSDAKESSIVPPNIVRGKDPNQPNARRNNPAGARDTKVSGAVRHGSVVGANRSNVARANSTGARDANRSNVVPTSSVKANSVGARIKGGSGTVHVVPTDENGARDMKGLKPTRRGKGGNKKVAEQKSRPPWKF